MELEGVSLLSMESSGGGAMIKGEMWYEVHSKFKLKESKKSIARSLGISVQTIRRILRQQEPKKGYERDIPRPLTSRGTLIGLKKKSKQASLTPRR